MQRTVSASELCASLGVTAATIRRDLETLEKEGILVRSHGGAVSRTPGATLRPSRDGTELANQLEKVGIAREAERLILDGETIFLEASTTVVELARRLHHRNRLTVVTNSPPIVCQLQRSPNVTVIATGGELQKDASYLSGVWAQHALSEIRVDKAVIGVGAIDPVYGISTATQAEAQLKRLILKSARVRIALADHTKFGKQGFAFVGPVTDFDILITDSGIDAKHVSALREAGLELIVTDLRSQTADAGRTASSKTRFRSGSPRH